MRITPILASTFRSDGGSMFGLVPKPLWSKCLEPDEQNRIRQNANVLLLKTGAGRTGLVDTGCGHELAFSERERQIHALSPDWPLMISLATHGVEPDSIDFVILTHLHWDHAGGVMTLDRQGQAHPTFPNAQHFVHALEWEAATSKDPLYHKAYPPSLIAFMNEHLGEQLVVLQGEKNEIDAGVYALRSGGHTDGHLVAVFEADDIEINHPAAASLPDHRLAVFAADVCPTQHHVRLVFQTAYDTYPLDTRRWKRTWLPRLAEDNGILFFDHDPDIFGATIVADPKREYVVEHALPVA